MTDKRLIHLIDDEEAVRKGLGFMLKTSGYAVQSWPSGVEFLKQVGQVDPGCILLDIRMPEMDGLEVQRMLNERGVRMPVILITGHGDVTLAVRAMRAGAVDFVEKPLDNDALLDAIGRAFERIDATNDALDRENDAERMLGALSEREREVLDLLARGYPNKTVAYDLGISPRTVEVHRANVMTKLGARSLAEALRVAFAAGMGKETE
ncbi:response regulator transcription factor [Stakelama tenebrarum]|uniref:Response regulator transcription factor n=1 Tax=Stakelama tenebrarum TaxID=2711215 RepID=A0A6G6Y5I5_9SPHN|nr:response regulator transcription factor [Sphingosinithalassobacter tenebrarum]QIG79853.1 response regulator transcription factor [Sphingosinithalassobacter tenebrarum]